MSRPQESLRYAQVDEDVVGISTACMYMQERLPTPYGLVRSGVAPDHPETKVALVQGFVLLWKAAISMLAPAVVVCTQVK